MFPFLSFTVISARNLQSKKRGKLLLVSKVQISISIVTLGVCLSSVVFGIGNDLFGTEVIESNEPVWNQEANLLVDVKCHMAYNI